MYTLLGLVI